MALLIDLSNNNPTPDFAKVKTVAAGVYLKASEGVNFTDATFRPRRASANLVGLHVGAYHFAHPDRSSAATQADFFCSVVGNIGLRDLRPCLDLEVPAKMTPPLVVGWARLFNQEVKKRLGVLPLFYSYSSYIAGLQARVPIGAGLWLAAYGRNDGKEYPYTVPAPWKKAVCHQFSSQATVPGCVGKVDLSQAASLTPLLAHPVQKVLADVPLPWRGPH